jgi:hypothetical protein
VQIEAPRPNRAYRRGGAEDRNCDNGGNDDRVSHLMSQHVGERRERGPGRPLREPLLSIVIRRGGMPARFCQLHQE